MEGCSRAVNVVSSINRVIPHLSSKDQEQNLADSHQLVIRTGLFRERLPILRYFYFFTVQKKSKIVDRRRGRTQLASPTRKTAAANQALRAGTHLSASRSRRGYSSPLVSPEARRAGQGPCHHGDDRRRAGGCPVPRIRASSVGFS
jgi:hypothetical protein